MGRDLSIRVLGLFLVMTMVSGPTSICAAEGGGPGARRVPAEWEPQEAIWLQWPGPYEKAFEGAFARMAVIIVGYERLHVLHASPAIRDQARAAIAKAGGDPDHRNLIWHAIASDNAWMRDNGPVYVVDGTGMRLQDWRFNAWGGAFGPEVPWRRDDAVPAAVGEYLGMPVERVDRVHERGNLEFNGQGALLLNWSTLGDPDRNPGYTRREAEADLRRHFGVDQVVFLEGVPWGDRTAGHVDGIARFIDPVTVVVPECRPGSRCHAGHGGSDVVFDAAAAAIEAAGFTVLRDPIEGVAAYRGETFDTNYVNWLVGNGFVIVTGFGNPVTDAAAQSRIASYFPGRDVYVVEMPGSWAAGGGAHCHTSDQPAASTVGTDSRDGDRSAAPAARPRADARENGSGRGTGTVFRAENP